MDLGVDALSRKHHQTILLMHQSMCEFMKKQNPPVDMDREEWDKEYINVPGASCDMNESCLYTVFYARYFDGSILTRILTKEARRLQKLNILCQMLSMKGNEGDAPTSLI